MNLAKQRLCFIFRTDSSSHCIFIINLAAYNVMTCSFSTISHDLFILCFNLALIFPSVPRDNICFHIVPEVKWRSNPVVGTVVKVWLPVAEWGLGILKSGWSHVFTALRLFFGLLLRFFTECVESGGNHYNEKRYEYYRNHERKLKLTAIICEASWTSKGPKFVRKLSTLQMIMGSIYKNYNLR